MIFQSISQLADLNNHGKHSSSFGSLNLSLSSCLIRRDAIQSGSLLICPFSNQSKQVNNSLLHNNQRQQYVHFICKQNDHLNMMKGQLAAQQQDLNFYRCIKSRLCLMEMFTLCDYCFSVLTLCVLYNINIIPIDRSKVVQGSSSWITRSIHRLREVVSDTQHQRNESK